MDLALGKKPIIAKRAYKIKCNHTNLKEGYALKQRKWLILNKPSLVWWNGTQYVQHLQIGWSQ
jgi:hypothetical protein